MVIPKVNEPKYFVDFRPISLCNTIYNIFTKAIYLRIQPFISKIISHEQGGFVLGRETPKGEIIAHEVLHSIKDSAFPSFIIKLDMMKAYDRVDWDFVIQVLQRFGFSLKWCKWICSCFSGADFLVIINGAPVGFFRST